MRRETINAIAVLLSLFTPEEQEGLKITSGTREVTLRDQFVGRWFNCAPRYSGQIFLYKAAAIVDGNRFLFRRVIELTKPENREKLMQQLSNPMSFVSTREMVGDSKTEAKTLTKGQSAAITMNRGATKARAGAAEYGDEFIELDKVWDRQDNEYLGQGMDKSSTRARIEIDESKRGLDSIGIKVDKIPEHAPNASNSGQDGSAASTTSEEAKEVPGFARIATDVDLDANEPALQSVNVSQSRTKAMTEGNTDTLNFGHSNSGTSMHNRSTDFTLFEALQAMTAAHIKDPRETAFQKLDILFTEPCL